MAAPSSPGQAGPDQVPPQLPEGWLAQWDGTSRKYYFVQRATGHSQWDIPTKPALSAPTPEPTPQGIDPFGKPIDTRPAPDAEYAGQDRGLLGDLAIGTLGGGKQSHHSSGLGGLASSFLSGSKPPGGQTPGIGEQLLSGLLGGSKPHGQTGSSQYQGQPGQTSAQGGLGPGNLLGGLLHGHHGQQNTNYGYNLGQSSGAGYSGQAPPVTYSPSGQPGQYGPTSGPYQPLGTNHQYGGGSQSNVPPSTANHATNLYQSQATPQPYNQTQPPQEQHYQSPPPNQPPNQYQGSNPGTPAYSQQTGQYSSQPPTATGYPQYGQQPQQQQQQGYPVATTQPAHNINYAPTGQSDFPPPPSSQPPPPYYTQQPPQSQQGSRPNFPQPSGQYGPSMQPQNYPPPPPPLGPGGPQAYNNSPAPPMHSHPSHPGYASAPPVQHTTYGGQGSDQYTPTYGAPPPPGWR